MQYPLKGSVNPEIVKNIARCKLSNYNCDVYKSIHVWNRNESENPFLISNLTKNADFLRKWQNTTFLVKKFVTS